MPNTCTFYQGGNFKLIGNPEADPTPKRFTVFLNGIDSIVSANEGACALQTWVKVLDHLQQHRLAAKRAGAEQAIATSQRYTRAN